MREGELKWKKGQDLIFCVPSGLEEVCHLQMPMLIQAIYIPEASGREMDLIHQRLPVTIHPLVCFGVI